MNNNHHFSKEKDDIRITKRIANIIRNIEIDLLFINLFSLALIITIVFDPISVLRPILGFLFVTFFPGYVFTKICFSEKEISIVERIALSFGMSMIIIPILGFILVYAFSEIDLYRSLFLIYLFILIFSIIGQYKPKFSLRGKTKFYFDIKVLNIVLTFILITIFGLYVRIYPTLKYSLLCGGWLPGNHLYPIYFTLQTGKLLEKGMIDTPTVFSNTIYNFIHNKAFIFFHVFIFLIMGYTNLGNFLLLNKFFPWYGILLFPLSALLIANIIAKNLRKKLTIEQAIFIYLISTFASYKLIVDSRFMNNNLIIGYILILFAIYWLLCNKNLRTQLVGILFGIFIYLYYYTAGFVFLIVLLTIYTIQEIKKQYTIPKSYIILYCIFFIIYYLYLASSVFRSFVMVFTKAISIPGEMPARTLWGRDIIKIDPAYISAYINFFLIIILTILFIYLWLRKEIIRNLSTNFTSYMILSLVLVFIVFYIYRGLNGATRISSYATIPFLLILCILLMEKPNLKRILYFASLLVISTSIIAYVPGTTTHTNYLTFTESASIGWYLMHNVTGKFVFTDARVGTAPIMLNCFIFTGIYGNTKIYPFENKALYSIYYGSSAIDSFKALEEYKASYILLSKEMQNYGILALADAYKPISRENLIKYESSSYFGKIYDNGGAYYYMLNYVE